MTDGRTNNGGTREGAGRPPAGTISVLLRLRRETIRALAQAVKRLPHGDRWGAKSRIADEAITAYLAKDAARNDRGSPPNT